MTEQPLSSTEQTRWIVLSAYHSVLSKVESAELVRLHQKWSDHHHAVVIPAIAAFERKNMPR